MSEITKLPTSGDVQAWTPAERALAESIGLRGADRPTIEAFLHHCARTRLDPVARQIYAIQRGGKWNIQVSIDGARLVAERSGQYRGQTAPQWTADGVTWVDVWLSKEPPAAARVGVYREGFTEPMIAVATMDQYRPGGKAPMWDKMPALMLAKCFDPETEVLTNVGFMKFADIRDEIIMQVTDLGIVPALEARPFAQTYDGPMIANHGDMLDFVVTPNHDMVTTVGKVEAGAMFATSRTRPIWRIPMTHDGSRADNIDATDDDLRLAAAIVADGSVTESGDFRVAVSRPAKVAALSKLEPKSRHVQHAAGKTVVTKTREIRTNFDKDVFIFDGGRVAHFIDRRKEIDVLRMLRLSPRQLRVFVDAWIEFDGHENRKTRVRRLYTSRVDHLAAAEVLAVAAGYSVNVPRKRTSDISDTPNYFITVSEPEPQPVVLPHAQRPGIKEEPNRSGVVWCVTVPSGKIVVRRRGFSMVCGNCAEALALRKAFPQDLSGLYTSEEMDQASEPMTATAPVKAPEPAQPEVPSSWSVDWRASAEACSTLEVLKRVWQECAEKQELNVAQDGVTARDVLIARSDALKAAETPPEPSLVDDADGIEDAEVIEEVGDAAAATA